MSMVSFVGKRVFLSGPITGREDFNRAEFAKAERIVRNLGAGMVYNPAELPSADDAHRHSHWMIRTLHELTEYFGFPRIEMNNKPMYDVLVLLDGWRESDGARVERVVAAACGIDVLEMVNIGEGGFEDGK